ncbi:SPFH domain-containing protein [Streptomyces tritici]|uniref:SPFH domain-containing protein n=1 Tax=Streptomyces tritici TaxID=2054410 RepID=UPI003AEF7605
MTTATPDRDREGEGRDPRTPAAPPDRGPAPVAGPLPVPAPEPGASSDGPPDAAPGPAGGAAADGPFRTGAPRTQPGRRTPVIGAETTGAIPVHRLFREDPVAPAGAVDPGPDTQPMPGVRPRAGADSVFDFEALFAPEPPPTGVPPARPHTEEPTDAAEAPPARSAGSPLADAAEAPAPAAPPQPGDVFLLPDPSAQRRTPEARDVVPGGSPRETPEPEATGPVNPARGSFPSESAGPRSVLPGGSSCETPAPESAGPVTAARGVSASEPAGPRSVVPGGSPRETSAPEATGPVASAPGISPCEAAAPEDPHREALAPDAPAGRSPAAQPSTAHQPAPEAPASRESGAPAGEALSIPEPTAPLVDVPASRDDSDAPREATIVSPAAPRDAGPRGRILDFEALFAPGQGSLSVGAATEATGGGGFQPADVRPGGLGSGVVPPAARRAVDVRRAPRPPRTPTPTPKAKRPAPTADPALRERPGPVLPGWIGVAVGAGALAACAAVLWWAGAVPDTVAQLLRLPVRPYHGIHLGQWALLALGVLLTLFSLGGLGRGRVGYAWVLTLFGEYRGTVRRTGLLWVSPLLLRRRVDVRLRHWRSEPLPAVDAKGTALDVVVLVVWRVRDTVRAALGVEHHEEYLREQVEAAMARVLSQLPADAFHEDAPTLRDAETVGEALTKLLSAECAPVGIDVFSAQPTRIEYAPEIAAAMQRRRIAAIDAKHRDSVLTSVVDAVDDMVHRLTTRGLVELDDYERKALVKDLTVAFYTGRGGGGEGA